MDESRLRWPWERWTMALSVLVNLGLMIGAIAIVAYGTEWLESHPFLAKRIVEIRLVAIAAIVAPPVLAVMRSARRGVIRGNSVRLSPRQIPEIYEVLEDQCEKLGLSEIPELYLSDQIVDSQAFWTSTQTYVVLSTRDLGPLTESREMVEFFLGRQLGAIRLGHTVWWNELLLWYVTRLPFIKVPVVKARCYSQDRYGAFLSPYGLRALIRLAAGRHMASAVDVERYLEQIGEYGDPWDRVGTFGSSEITIARRVNALRKAGLLGIDPETVSPE